MTVRQSLHLRDIGGGVFGSEIHALDFQSIVIDPHRPVGRSDIVSIHRQDNVIAIDPDGFLPGGVPFGFPLLDGNTSLRLYAVMLFADNNLFGSDGIPFFNDIQIPYPDAFLSFVGEVSGIFLFPEKRCFQRDTDCRFRFFPAVVPLPDPVLSINIPKVGGTAFTCSRLAGRGRRIFRPDRGGIRDLNNFPGTAGR